MRRWLVLLAACGGGNHHTTDAPPVDAVGDSLPISSDASPTSVSLRVTRQGQPVANVATFFLAADGTKVAALATDGSGTAAALLGAGGSVTAILQTGAGVDELRTFTGVMPGDALVLELQPAGPQTGAPITMTAPTDPGAYDYSLYSSCGDRTGSLDGSFSFTPLGCGSTADFLVTANDSLEAPTAMLLARGVSLAGTPAITGAYAAPVTTAFGYSVVPAVLASVATHVVLLGSGGPLYAADDAQAVTGGSLTTHAAMPDTTGLGMTMEVASQLYPIASEFGQQAVYDWVAASAPYNADLTAAMLPRYVTAPAYDAASRSIAWGEAPAAEDASLVRARVHVFRSGIPSRTWSWEIVAAKTGTNVTFPPLPALDSFSFVPVAGDTVTIDEVTTARVPGGYAALRTHAFADPATQITTGRAVVETIYTPPL